MKNTMIKKAILVLMSGMMIFGLCAFTGVDASAGAGNPPANPPEKATQPQDAPQPQKPVEPAPADTPEPQPEPLIPQLSDSEITGLKEAVKAGKDAVAMYQYLIDHFGEQDAFVQNMASQQAELAELLRLAEKYGIDVSAISPDSLPTVASLDDALTLAAKFENEHAGLFGRLPVDSDHEDLAELYANIKNVAQNNHLPRLEMKG